MNNLLNKLLIATITVLLIALGGCGGGGTAKPDVVYFVHTDHLGTPAMITDSTQATVWQGDKTPFGETTATVNQIAFNVRFPGQYYDQESGLHYNYFRDYDPSLGRYVQSDPIGLRGGLNTYGYVYQNPLRYIDPNGKLTLVEGAVGVGAVGAVYCLLNPVHCQEIIKACELAWAAWNESSESDGAMLGEQSEEFDTDNPKTSNPLTGEPGSSSQSNNRNGERNQERFYDKDGFPEVDFDYDHNHKNDDGTLSGSPHAHNWDRPADGSLPSATDRGPGFPVSPLPR